MKKTISLIALLLLLSLTLASCASQNDQQTAPPTPDSSQGEAMPNAGAMIMPKFYYGKVKQVIGNQITLRLAEDPAADETESGSGTDGAVGNAPLDGMGSDAVAAVGAVPAVGGMDDGKEHLQLEYLDEEKSFTIPAGVKIYDQKTGQELQLTALKKGAVLMIVTNQENGAVLEILVWEQA